MSSDRPPQALTINGRTSTLLKARDGSEEEEVARAIERLDGIRVFSIMLWALPDDVSFDRVDLKTWPQSFIQAAGAADRMTIELRESTDTGARHSVLGRDSHRPDRERDETIVWDCYETRVTTSQIFHHAESHAIFVSYFRTGRLPDGYALTPMDPSRTTQQPT